MNLKPLVFFTFFSLSSAHAGIVDVIISKCAQYLEKPYLELVETNSKETLLLNTKEFKTESEKNLVFGLTLGNKLGAGFFGQVVVVDEISDPDLEKLIRGIPPKQKKYSGIVVVKIPHALRAINFGLPLPYTNAENQNEYAFYQKFMAQLKEIENSSLYPKNAAFQKGTLPAAPILYGLKSNRGFLIFKPLVKGLNLKQIAKIYAANGNKLSDEMTLALKNHYQLVQAVFEKTGISIDIRPPNLVWLNDKTSEEKDQLKFLGYSKSGFIAYEMAQVPANKPQYIHAQGLSFEQYLQEYVDYLKVELEEHK
jgi:hypothetical protein